MHKTTKKAQQLAQPLNRQEPSHNLDFSAQEWERLQDMSCYERQARQQGYAVVAGIDEAGRGPLAGPVLAAACVIPPDVFIEGVNDSKKLTPKQRFRVFEAIVGHKYVQYGIGRVDSEEIDRINILQATIQAMLQAVSKLACIPDLLLVDGLQLVHASIPCKKIIGGDALSQSIAAASILAKETRDRLMLEYHEKWPHYGFDQHKGYGTEKHMKALAEHGPCPIHRFSFEPVARQSSQS